MMKSVWMIAVMTIFCSSSQAGTLAERILASYEPIRSLSCEIRRDTEAGPNKIRTLSRVYFQKPDRLHVENYSPLKRRIVADGTTFFSYIEGDPQGFSRPIDKLTEEMLIQLRKVPGTAMDHLMKLKGISETGLSATAEFPERKGYDTGKRFVVLSLDKTGRLARVEFYATPDMKNKTAQYDYSDFQEAAGGAWIPCLHQAVLNNAGVEAHETVRVDNLSVNTPVPANLFVAGPFFQGVKFVDEFGKIYE